MIQVSLRRFMPLVLLFGCASAGVMAQKITKETIVSEGKKRTYYLYVPKAITPSAPVPLIVLLLVVLVLFVGGAAADAYGCYDCVPSQHCQHTFQ